MRLEDTDPKGAVFNQNKTNSYKQNKACKTYYFGIGYIYIYIYIYICKLKNQQSPAMNQLRINKHAVNS